MSDAEVVDLLPDVVPVEAPHRPSVGELVLLSERIARTKVAPPALRNKPDDVFAVMAFAAELGLPPVNALSLIDFLNDRPVLNAQGRRALILGAGHDIWTETRTTTEAVVCGQRKGSDRVYRAEYTWADAETAKLVTKDNWKQNPKAMLVARATVIVSREAFADVLLGQAWDAEELESLPAAPPPPPPEPVPISASMQAQVTAAFTKDGLGPVDIAVAVTRATQGRTDDLAGLLTSEVTALRDAHQALRTRASEEVATDAHVVDEEPAPEPAPSTEPPVEPEMSPLALEPCNAAERRSVMGALTRAGINPNDRERRLRLLSGLAGRELESSNDMTHLDVARALDALYGVHDGRLSFVYDDDGNPIGVTER